MASGFSPQNEAFIQNAITQGFYPTLDALLNEAVDVLRLREPSGDKLLAALQVGMDDIAAGRVEEWDVEDVKRRYRERLVKRQAMRPE